MTIFKPLPTRKQSQKSLDFILFHHPISISKYKLMVQFPWFMNVFNVPYGYLDIISDQKSSIAHLLILLFSAEYLVVHISSNFLIRIRELLTRERIAHLGPSELEFMVSCLIICHMIGVYPKCASTRNRKLWK